MSGLDLMKVEKELFETEKGFENLKQSQQALFLKHLKKTYKTKAVLSKRGYDILLDKFFVETYALERNDEGKLLPVMHRKTFTTFKAYFDYLDGDAYTNSCYFGYEFSEKEIKEFNLQTEHLNFESFIDFDVDDAKNELIHEQEKSDRSTTKSRNGFHKWIMQEHSVDTPEEFGKLLKKYDYSKGVAFLLIKNGDQKLKDAAYKWFCEDQFTYFIDMVVLFGEEKTKEYIDGYNPNYYVKQTIYRKKRELKDMFQSWKSGEVYSEIKEKGYNEDIGVYYVTRNYKAPGFFFTSFTKYFLAFGEFAKEVNYDLKGAYLSKSPLDEISLKNCIVDDTTKLPTTSVKGDPSFNIVGKRYSEEHFYASVEMTYGKTTTRKDYTFDYICDFIHFLKKDLSNADLYGCNNISRLSKITGLNVERAKMKLDGIEAFNLQKEEDLILPSLPCVSFEVTKGNELETIDQYRLVSGEQNEYTLLVSYMSDVHLTHKLLANSCKTIYDAEEEIRELSNVFFNKTQTKISLFVGDLTDKFDLYEKFLKCPVLFRHKNKFFFTLGNHELWAFPNQSLEETITKYRCLLEDEGINLVQNDVYYFQSSDPFFLRDPTRISEQELKTLSSDDLHKKLRDASLIIFGGIGFAGANPTFNATSGIYQNVLSREEEIEETKKFCDYYKKVIDATKGMHLIVLTHMPVKDWLGEEKYEPGVLYVNGHTHNNYRYDDGIKRVYSDNQSGYISKSISWKETSTDFGFDWFKDYKDGVYPISLADYRVYYRGINERMNLKKEPGQLYLLKRDGLYMFLCKKEKLYFMQGGKKLNLENQDVEYYYKKMEAYANSIKECLSEYELAQNRIANEIKKIGGSGLIHGCIIDIDFFNHIYLNILDGKATPYYASFITAKMAYQNVASLLSDKCPTLYSKYQALIDGTKGNSLTTLGDNKISKKTYFVTDTSMYRISRLIKQLQFIGDHGLIRQWNDEVANKASKENGTLILRDMLIGEEQ